MKRYVTKNQWNGDLQLECPGVDVLARVVIEADPTAYDTGLLDSTGSPIMVANIMDPIGFVHLKERH